LNEGECGDVATTKTSEGKETKMYGEKRKKNCSAPLATKFFADFQEVGENVKKC
jgi:hypothetical protein